MTHFDEVKQAKSLHKHDILSKPNVVGVGVDIKLPVNGLATS